jgi:hypothetical protein
MRPAVRSLIRTRLSPVMQARVRILASAVSRVTWRVVSALRWIPTHLFGTGPQRWLRLGQAQERSGRPSLAARSYRTAIDRDPLCSDAERELLAITPERFPPRRELVRFVAAQLPAIRDSLVRRDAVENGCPPRIYVYWGQGFDSAPGIVQLCRRALLDHHDAADVIFLDDDVLGEYVDMPAWVSRRVTSPAHYSDIVRLEMLWRYGGIWMDATCLPTGRVLDRMPDLSASGFFAFEYRPARFSNWFLACRPGNRVVGLLLEAQYRYWETYDKPIDYFVTHALFEALVAVDAEFRDAWAASPRPSADPPHEFQRRMHEPYEAAAYRALLDGCFVHKLTYKFDPRLLDRPTMLARLVADARIS